MPFRRALAWVQRGPRPAANKTSFQYLSDLHLEVGQQYDRFHIEPTAPYLILAGDIGRLHDYDPLRGFLARQCARYQLVFYILGNHEYYKSSRQEALAAAEKLQNEATMEGKLVVLNRRRYDINNRLTVLGCTLQSEIDEDKKLLIQMKVADFTQIESWSVDNHLEEHRRDREWLKDELRILSQKQPMRQVIVVTHHAPSYIGASLPAHNGSELGSAFCTELLRDSKVTAWPGFAQIKIWIYGHTHWTNVFNVNGVTAASNQRGYVLNPESEKEVSVIGFRSIWSNKKGQTHLFDSTRTVTV